MKTQNYYDVIIVGGGAAGLMCAIEAGKRSRKVLILDHAKKPAEKIRISGGGRCNFTNLHCEPKNFISQNPHFCKSALARYSQHDFISLVSKHHIPFHEKTLGQLFCDHSSKNIIEMLLKELHTAGGELYLETDISSIQKQEGKFNIETSKACFSCQSLVIATGGKSIPKMGATGFGYKVAEQFELSIIKPRPALVPFTHDNKTAETWAEMSGISMPIRASIGNISFDEAMLITHRGVSGPAILQISSYWHEGEDIIIDLLPTKNITDILKASRGAKPATTFAHLLTDHLPKRFAAFLSDKLLLNQKHLAEISKQQILEIHKAIHRHPFKPGGTEGYRTAEVTRGGVDTRQLCQKTMEVKSVPGLFFIGEVVDVTGHLGGHNFQWAWSSGYAAGQAA